MNEPVPGTSTIGSATAIRARPIRLAGDEAVPVEPPSGRGIRCLRGRAGICSPSSLPHGSNYSATFSAAPSGTNQPSPTLSTAPVFASRSTDVTFDDRRSSRSSSESPLRRVEFGSFAFATAAATASSGASCTDSLGTVWAEAKPNATTPAAATAPSTCLVIATETPAFAMDCKEQPDHTRSAHDSSAGCPARIALQRNPRGPAISDSLLMVTRLPSTREARRGSAGLSMVCLLQVEEERPAAGLSKSDLVFQTNSPASNLIGMSTTV